MKMGDPLPELDGPGVTWLNDGAGAATAPGAVTLVHFFSVSCELCKTQLPQIVEWRDRTYAGKIHVIGVHMPRYPEDVDLPRVRAVAQEHRLTHPVAVDDEHAITDRFANEFVPAYYTFDREGKLAHKKAGETALKFVQQAIDRALEEKG